MASLFSPITVRSKTIKNRIVMPPMVCFGYAGRDGMVTERNVRHYADRAKGGAGLVIIEATCVTETGRLSDVQLGLWSDAQTEGFRKLATAVHEHGAVVLVQIHHGGLATARSVSADIIAPSDFSGTSNYSGGPLTARAMSLKEIHQVQADFVSAAQRAKTAGLDGIELHGAHGFLLSQFFSLLVNKRQDAYGGNLTNRTRFATEIVRQIRQAAGSDFIIGCRMGGYEPTLADGIQIAQVLAGSGVDLLHVSTGMANLVETADKEPAVPSGFPYNWIVYAGTQIKKNVNTPVIVVNGIRTPSQAAYLIENGLADFAAIGKGLLANPDWPNQAQRAATGPTAQAPGTEGTVLTCLDCKTCAYFRPGAVCPAQKAA